MVLTLDSADAAEQAFYAAFSDNNLSAMRALWDTSDDVICVHPMSASLQGFDAVMRSWEELFTNGDKLTFTPHVVSRYADERTATHHVYELIQFGPGGANQSVIIATNAYRLTDAGWRMVLHHGSPGRGVQIEAPKSAPIH